MIVHRRCALEVELLEENDFIDSAHKEIYLAIKELIKANKNFDDKILISSINKRVKSENLMFIAENKALKLNWKEYVKQLKDLTLKRRLHDIAEKIMNSDTSGEDMSEYAEKEIFKLRENIITEDFTDIKLIVMDAYKQIEDEQEQKGYTGLETGFVDLDRITGGLQDADYILLGARPSMGKTALALNVISNAAMRGKKVVLFSLEMSEKQVMKRLLLSESFISGNKLKNKSLDKRDYDKLLHVARGFCNSNISINDNASLTVAQMKSMSRKLKRTKGLDLIVVDYLQLIKSKEGKIRREQVEAVSRDLKVMAKELNVPVVVISSLSRANESRNDKRPILSDLRETGQMEFDADLIIFLHREHYYDREANPGQAELIIAKQRNGSLGVIELSWVGECTKFMDL